MKRSFTFTDGKLLTNIISVRRMLILFQEAEEVNPVPTEASVDESSVVEDAVKAEIITGEDTEQVWLLLAIGYQ